MSDVIPAQKPQISLPDETLEKAEAFEKQIEELFDNLRLKTDTLNTETLGQTLGGKFNDESEISHYYTRGIWGRENITFALLDKPEVKAFLELLNVFTVTWFSNVSDPLDAPLNRQRYQRTLIEMWASRTEELGIKDLNVTRGYVAHLFEKYYPKFLEIFPKKGLPSGQ